MKRGKFDTDATTTVLWIGFLGGLLVGLGLSALYLGFYALQ